MENKNTAIIDLTNCRYILDFHERIRKALDFPDFYGANWSAFDDMMWSECTAEKIIIVGAETMPKEFDEVLKMMCKILDKNIQWRAKYGEKLEYEFVRKDTQYE